MAEEIRRYDSLSVFLNDCKSMLMQKECENNVILGICNQFLNKPADSKKLMLLAATDKDGIIVSCAMTTSNKTTLAVFASDVDTAVKPLASYFNRHQITLKGLAGKSATVNSFLKVYDKPVTASTTLILNTLNTLRNVELVPDSELSLATMQDLPVLTTWLGHFQIDAGLLPLRPKEEIQAVVEDKITNQVLYKLVMSGDQHPISMAAVVRQTENFAFISWVYTPLELRGRGFATTTVYKLSKRLLEVQQKRCALFTDKSNPVSNKIYQNIGYQPMAEQVDVAFETL